jgi:hypothetical protein
MPRWRVVLVSLCLLGLAWGEDKEPAAPKRPVAPKKKPKKPHMNALQWLAAHQDEDGHWDCDGFAKHDPEDDQCDGTGAPDHDVAMTGLSLLAFLRSGYTDAGTPEQNPFGGTVRRGLAWLVARQKENGVIRGEEPHFWIYGHVIVTNALCEAWALTGDDRYRAPAQRALDYLYSARNPDGGWRYDPRENPSDTSVTTWCVLAFDAARRGGLRVDNESSRGARRWVQNMTDMSTWRVGYFMRGRPMNNNEGYSAESVRTSTAGGILIRMLTGESTRSKAVKEGAKLVLEVRPAWDRDKGSIDLYYWFFATTALKKVGGAAWSKWSRKLRTTLERNLHQPGSGARTGSLDPVGSWGKDGGRVMTTAFCALCLAQL